MNAIDLGKKYEGASLAEPVGATKPSPAVNYPTLYLSLDGDALKNLPDSGTMTVKYKVRRRTATSDAKGKKSMSADVDILKIVGAEAAKEKSSSEALDELAAEVATEGEGDYD